MLAQLTRAGVSYTTSGWEIITHYIRRLSEVGNLRIPDQEFPTRSQAVFLFSAACMLPIDPTASSKSGSDDSRGQQMCII